MKLWKDFQSAAKDRTVTFVIPGIYDNGLELERYEVTEEALIWTDGDGNIQWLSLARIAQGMITTAAPEE